MNNNKNIKAVKIKSTQADEISKLMVILEKSFASTMKDYPKEAENTPMPCGNDILDMSAKGKDIIGIYENFELVGGAVLTINRNESNNTVELLFISAEKKDNGLGTQAWYAIENLYPDTKKWELGTPYFLKRNVHFYINKCGFCITKYYNKHNPFIDEDKIEDGDFFWFEKKMS